MRTWIEGGSSFVIDFGGLMTGAYFLNGSRPAEDFSLITGAFSSCLSCAETISAQELSAKKIAALTMYRTVFL